MKTLIKVEKHKHYLRQERFLLQRYLFFTMCVCCSTCQVEVWGECFSCQKDRWRRLGRHFSTRKVARVKGENTVVKSMCLCCEGEQWEKEHHAHTETPSVFNYISNNVYNSQLSRIARKQDSKYSVNFGVSHQDSNQKSRKLQSLPLPLQIGRVSSFLWGYWVRVPNKVKRY